VGGYRLLFMKGGRIEARREAREKHIMASKKKMRKRWA